MKRIIGIDPGANGAIASLSKRGKYYRVDDSWLECNTDCLIEAIRKVKPHLVLIEKQQAMSKQGVVSTFTTGRNFGLLEGVLQALKVNYIVVSPKEWMSVVHNTYGDKPVPESLATSNLKDTKIRNISLCLSLFDVELRTPRGRWIDGLADAILISLYGFIKDIK